MKVWLVKVGEPLPTDEGAQRRYRTGMIAQNLTDRGHDVTWWTSTLNHATKEHRSSHSREDEIAEGFRVIQLHGCAYKGNVSLARIRNHRQEAAQFAREAASRRQPDVILCSYPTIDLSVEAVRYGRSHDVPVVLDVRDLWPDIFLDVLPTVLRPIGRGALAGAFRDKRYAFRNATAVVGTSESFVDWALKSASRPRNRLDRAFAHGYPAVVLSAEQRERALAFWHRQFRGPFPDNIVCFFGNFSEHVLDLDTVVRAARALEEAGEDVAFVLCGTGPSQSRIRESAQDLRSIHLPGRIDLAEIRILMEHALAGLVPYAPRWDFELNLPNKAIEYLSAGLPIITCLAGELQDLVVRHDCGAFYASGDAAALATTIRSFLTDRGRWESRRRAASKLFDCSYSAERIYSDYVRHLEMIGGMKPGT